MAKPGRERPGEQKARMEYEIHYLLRISNTILSGFGQVVKHLFLSSEKGLSRTFRDSSGGRLLVYWQACQQT